MNKTDDMNEIFNEYVQNIIASQELKNRTIEKYKRITSKKSTFVSLFETGNAVFIMTVIALGIIIPVALSYFFPKLPDSNDAAGYLVTMAPNTTPDNTPENTPQNTSQMHTLVPTLEVNPIVTQDPKIPVQNQTSTPTPTPIPMQTPTMTSTPIPIERGNSGGNISNLGMVVQKDGWQYFSYFENDQNKKLAKSRIDGTEFEVLSNDSALYLNLINDWIYYINQKDFKKIYKIRTDGSERTIVSDQQQCFLMNVLGEWIYYQSDSSIYRMKIDGTSVEKLTIENADRKMYVEDGWIYYLSNGRPRKIRIDGSDLTKLGDEICTQITVVEGWIYYVAAPENNSGDLYGSKIYKMRTDGTQNTFIIERPAMNLNVLNGWIYFHDTNAIALDDVEYDKFTLCKVRTDGSDYTKLSDKTGYIVNVIDEHIYFISDVTEPRAFIRTKTDGTEPQILWSYYL